MPSALIVFAHMEKASFNAAMLDVAKTTLEEHGHDVTVSDLYKMNFNPVMSRNDTTDSPANGHNFQYSVEMGRACARGTLADDIRSEQNKVAAADLIIFQYPMQCLNMPAIMVGWLNRVLLENFAFNFAESKIMDQGLLKGKKALLSLTTGGAADDYSASGSNGDIGVVLWPVMNTLYFTGLSLLRPHVCYGIPGSQLPDRTAMLDAWGARLQRVFTEAPVPLPRLCEFHGHPFTGLTLPASHHRPGDAHGEYGATPGQHMGRTVPSWWDEEQDGERGKGNGKGDGKGNEQVEDNGKH